MGEPIEGSVIGKGLKFGIVVSRFNDFVTSRLLEGAIDGFKQCGVDERDVIAIRVPGSFEIPMVAKKMAMSNKYNAVVCLGAVIRGATPHFEYIAAEVTKGIASIALEAGIPVIYGVLTTDTVEQAIERAGTKNKNRGWDAAMQAVEMANLYKLMK
ncbi:MAG TPA: 6,7-dimethyl-8-ribityllumazine synthase [Nitrospiraceae bacterium]|nr:MAG: 6,7-dimethyl-8-ribityllumazine synthase [Nitrospirae bacterium RIFCSPLOWO2_02_42_7]HAS17233.1 6,7-dimethyl-8-ribityllumazine synthase [Nitrospiraceae bacterium]HBI22770.1 6,7-dimethyl-8-ribityllumazine synthase [Nitrospiraceae bacterium]